MIKLIASDMDGTLLNDGEISEYNLEMILKAQAKGIKFVIASGRTYPAILPILQKHNFKCDCVTGNGAEYVDSEGKLVSARYLSLENALAVMEILDKTKLEYMIYTTTKTFSTKPVEIVQDAFVYRGYHRFGKHNGQSIEDTRAQISKTHACFKMEQLDNYQEALKDYSIIKIEAFYYDEKEVVKAKKELAKLGDVSYLSSYPDNVEITNIEATKGNILFEASKLYGIQKDEVMVLGDGMNDMSMFELFKCGVAMENAVQELKDVAMYVTDHFQKDGVGKAIEKYALKTIDN